MHLRTETLHLSSDYSLSSLSRRRFERALRSGAADERKQQEQSDWQEMERSAGEIAYTILGAERARERISAHAANKDSKYRYYVLSAAVIAASSPASHGPGADCRAGR